jgi:shikimate dehydrogenase
MTDAALPDAHTRLALLLGDPVAHSLSPLIHNTAFRGAGVNAVYLAARVAPAAVAGAVAGLRALDVMGANVTIPHKRAVIPHLDRLTPEAEAIGAVNTITRLDDGTLRGDNTDAAGFLNALDADALRGTEAVVFGNGGAARAVVYALLTAIRPVSLVIAARTPDRAEALAQSLSALDERGALRVVPLAEAGDAVRRSRLVVNATSVGMHPNDDATVWPHADDFDPGQTVYDLVYVPAETRLLRDAARRGAETIGGLTMLIGQAAAAFEQWTGHAMPVDAVGDALRAHINQ